MHTVMYRAGSLKRLSVLDRMRSEFQFPRYDTLLAVSGICWENTQNDIGITTSVGDGKH